MYIIYEYKFYDIYYYFIQSLIGVLNYRVGKPST